MLLVFVPIILVTVYTIIYSYLNINMRIKKKVQQEYFEAVVEGKKRFEVRLANFKCKPGDTLVLKE
ncbi:MAG: hypothetical protein COY82_01865 [Parcubacteria group bacterium CG_4_10_14_0_8_um_filter_35_7]|nr:MAG: hypothetical protein COX43_01615 [Parcubacteria group bacterium CG23_combo_of_CG06-09_8_20_14_all_35_9]PIY78553.1 MAG: hypothetical protein COY82_01865 [Parcubacteria group bacterium CG_4_10_14_0_8_um_filter_35_7]